MPRKSKIKPVSAQADPLAQVRAEQERGNRCISRVNNILTQHRCKLVPEMQMMGTNATTNIVVVADRVPLFDFANRLRSKVQRSEACGTQINAALTENGCSLHGGFVLTVKGNVPIVSVVPNPTQA